MIFVEMMFWVKFYMNLSAFLCFEMIGQLSESNLGTGKLKLGFLGGEGLNAVATHFARLRRVILLATRVVHDVRWPQ